MPGAWRSIDASSSARAELRYQRSSASAAAVLSGARSSSAPAFQPALARGAVTTRSATASPPCQATPARARPSASGCRRARARSSHGVSVVSAPSMSPARALTGTTSSGPPPGTSTSRTRRARDERRTRTFTAPLRSSTVRSALHARQTMRVRAEQITEPLANHGEGPCWLASSGEVAWVDMLAGRVLVTVAGHGTTREIDIPSRVAAIVRPRAGGRPGRRERDGRPPAR